MRKVKVGVNHNHQGLDYLSEDNLQLQISSTKAEMDKVEKILKITSIVGICRGEPINRDSVKNKGAEWIFDKLGLSINKCKCISIIPIIPTGGAKVSIMPS